MQVSTLSTVSDTSNVTDNSADEVRPGGLDDQLCFAMYSAMNTMTRFYRPLLADIDLTYPQYLVMLILWEQNETSVSDIAARLDLAPHAVSPIIDRLESRGVAARSRDAKDGRVVRISSTELGDSLRSRALSIQGAARCRTELDDSEVALLRTELLALADRMSGHTRATAAHIG